MVGPNHPNWKGGIATTPYPNTFDRFLKRKIKDRDNYQCHLCGYSTKKLAIHHIDYNKNNCDPSNLITLCRGCNATVNFNREHWRCYFVAQLAFTHPEYGIIINLTDKTFCPPKSYPVLISA
jgi:hypothetical protein